LVFTPTLKFNGDDFNPSYTLDPVLLHLDLGVLQTGDTMSWVYTLTAQGTTHGFERGYYAALAQPARSEVRVRPNTAEAVLAWDAPLPWITPVPAQICKCSHPVRR
jgi:hypothetical protein